MAEQKITYEQLFDALRREKSRDELQVLDPNFYEYVRVFLREKQDVMQNHAQGGLASQRASIECQNVKKILRELYDRRERKILTLAMHKTRTEMTGMDVGALLTSEHTFFDDIVRLLQHERERLFSAVEGTESLLVDQGSLHASTVSSRAWEEPPATASNQQFSDHTTTHITNHTPINHTPTSTVDIATGDTFSTIEQSIMVRFVAPVPKFVGRDGQVFGPFSQDDTAKLPDEIGQILVKKGRAQIVDELE